MLDLTLLDYGVGNIHSLKKAFEKAGARVAVTSDPGEILKAKGLLLPGVGAFPKVAEMIAPIREPLREKLQGGLPAFCVCIGMQILYESSEEGPGAGLGLKEGMVRRLRHERLPDVEMASFVIGLTASATLAAITVRLKFGTSAQPQRDLHRPVTHDP